MTQLKKMQAKAAFRIQVDELHRLFVAAFDRQWAAIKEEATFKSNMLIEGTAGELAERRSMAS
jgi:hypothetical protein